MDPTSSNDGRHVDREKPAARDPKAADPKAAREQACDTVSRPGGFQNDPDDPTNPNEAIERSRQTLRPNPLPRSKK
jgi:hypothetical protein